MGGDGRQRDVARNIELIVTDLDGTLWEQPETVHDRARDAIAQISVGDVPLLVATGRRVASTRTPLAAMGLVPPAVVLNGALGLDLRSGRRFHQGGFSVTDAVDVLTAFLSCDVEPCIYIDHDHLSVWVGTSPSTHPAHLASLGDDVSSGQLADIVEREPVLAFGVLGIAEGAAERLGAALARVATPHVSRDRQYGGFGVTVAPLRQSKWDGVAAFCAQEGIDEQAVLAIGDGPNDVELLARAAVAVTPEDAHPEARAHADHVVGTAADGGWADILDLVPLA